MKHINIYINEKLRLTTKRTYTCQPKNKVELRKIILQRIKNEGPECDLNDIDTSKITSMSWMLDAADNNIFKYFNGDISQWNVSNVKDMMYMFPGCENFDCDISMWNVSNVRNMVAMFWGCKKFKQNLDSWDVSNVKYMKYAFKVCPTTPTWYDRKQYD